MRVYPFRNIQDEIEDKGSSMSDDANVEDDDFLESLHKKGT